VVQSGKPIGVLHTHPNAPVVIMACRNYVGRWATPDNFYQQAQLGRTMWGGLTAGDWHYIGSQGVLQGTYEILCAVARQHFDGSLRGMWVLTAGLGGMGTAQPLAVSMASGVGLVVEVERQRLEQAGCASVAQLDAQGYSELLATHTNDRALVQSASTTRSRSPAASWFGQPVTSSTPSSMCGAKPAATRSPEASTWRSAYVPRAGERCTYSTRLLRSTTQYSVTPPLA